MGFRVLFADPLGESGRKVLEAESDIEIVDKRLSPDELVAEIGAYDAMVVRSATTVTAAVIDAGVKLKAIGRAGVGVDNIDVPAATKRGIIVLNAPGGNTLSTAEHAVSMLMALARNIPQAVQSLREGKWEKNKFAGAELYDKTLGIMGLGRIGSEVARRMQAFGMRVIAFDPIVSPDRAKALGVTMVDFDALLGQADFLSVHSPLTPETENAIAAPQLRQMKPTARLVNCARGGIVNEADLYEALKAGTIAGAAFDVFVKEPPGEHPLLTLPNFIATPHIGAATAEAQIKVAADVAEQLINALRGRPVATAVNVPAIDPVLFQELQPYLDLAERLGRFLSQYATGRVQRITTTTSGLLETYDPAPIGIAAVKGFLDQFSEEPVNYVNAPVLLESRGIEREERFQQDGADYSQLISVTATTADGQARVAGTLHSHTDPRLVQIDGYRTDVRPSGVMILVHNQDAPGVIRDVSTVLAEHQVNIANMDVGRDQPGGTAVTIINVDTEINEAQLAEIAQSPHVISAKVIRV